MTALSVVVLEHKSSWLSTRPNKRTRSSVYDRDVRNKAELRDDILTAARDEFAQHGLAGARIDRIARSAQASKERLYAHFGDKSALFREVVMADAQDFVRSMGPRMDDVGEFVGTVYDIARTQPERIRMIMWGQLENAAVEAPPADGHIPAHLLAALTRAQAGGRVDPSWDPLDLAVMLFGIALAWAHWPDPSIVTDDEQTHRRRRAAAVDAALRVAASNPPG